MGTITIVSVVVVAIIYTVDACSVVTKLNGSCCALKSSDFRFSEHTTLSSRNYKIVNFCGNCRSEAYANCDAKTDGGGWLVIQRIQHGRFSFDQGWVEYEEGFGHLHDEFWYGLRSIHCLTNQGQWELRIDLTHTNRSKTYLHYKKFSVGPPSDAYPLQISQYSGIYPVDPFSSHSLNGMPFSTKDRDNDKSGNNCAVEGNGKNSNGWWFNACAHITLNKQFSEVDKVYDGKSWHNYRFIEMKIRPITCA